MKMIFAALDEGEAALLLSLLEADDIPAQVWTPRSEVGQANPQIWLHNESDVERGAEIIREYVRGLGKPPADGELWQCGGCGEKHEASFSECWKCGKGH